MDAKITAIVPSAGLGRRFDPARRKTFVSINGVPLLVYTLKRLHREGLIVEIIPVIRQEDTVSFKEMLKEHRLDKIKRVAPGGPERQDSIYNALKLLEEDGTGINSKGYVLIHDGVRPYISEGIVDKLVKEIKGVDGVIPGVPLKDTIKEIDEGRIVVSTLDRDRLSAVQTPQFFSFSALKKAYDKAYKDGFYATDDAGLIERTGGRIRIIEGSPFNIKVTTPEDLRLVEFLLAENT
ncbi:MAG: 2-C-methyl-D-erythritol 4-phosphate cytidylyltransferase [Nitrospirota bacterium]